MSLKASISGIRGIVGESLTFDVLMHYTEAFATLVPEGQIIIGRDSRPTGNMISTFVRSVLMGMGREVLDVGLVPTPTLLYLVKALKASGGIVVTASHNPIEWNALKLVNSQGLFLSPQEFEKLNELYHTNNPQYVNWEKVGTSSKDFIMPKLHIQKIASFVNKKLIASKKFTVALDTVNGAAGPLAEALLQRFNCTVKTIHTEPTGHFAHPPEPTPENLNGLSILVHETNADIGFAFDPDGDRLVICGSNGIVLSEEYTLALAVKHYLSSRKKTNVIINTSTSRLVEDIAKANGVKTIRVPTGEIHVTTALLQQNAYIGGEGNGGVIIPKINGCRDALLGMAFILEYLAMSNNKIEELADNLGTYSLIKTKIGVASFEQSIVEQKLRQEFPNGKFTTIDGIRIDFDNSWVLIRVSNTEPIIRVFAESTTTEESENLIAKVKKLINS